MSDLDSAIIMIRSNRVTGEQTIIIDKELSKVSCNDIGDFDVNNVIEYIDMQLLHNIVDQDIKQQLDHLYSELRERQSREK